MVTDYNDIQDKSGESRARIWQKTAKIETKKDQQWKKQTSKQTKKAGPRRLALARSLKNRQSFRNKLLVQISTFSKGRYVHLPNKETVQKSVSNTMCCVFLWFQQHSLPVLILCHAFHCYQVPTFAVQQRLI